MASTREQAQVLYAQLKKDIGNYPHWSVNEIQDCLDHEVSVESITAEWRLLFGTYYELKTEARVLLSQLKRDHGERAEVTEETMLYWLDQKFTNEQIRVEYCQLTPREGPNPTAKAFLAQLKEEFGPCRFITEESISRYLERDLSVGQITYKYRWRVEQAAKFEKAQKLQAQLKEELGSNLNISIKELMDLYDEGKEGEEIKDMYRAMHKQAGQ